MTHLIPVKVKKVIEYDEIFLCEARLIIIHTDSKPVRGSLCFTTYKEGSSGYHIADNLDIDITPYSIVKESVLALPYLISDTEEIYDGELCVYRNGSDNGKLISWIAPFVSGSSGAKYKILAYPENLCHIDLRYIVENKFKTESEILIECEEEPGTDNYQTFINTDGLVLTLFPPIRDWYSLLESEAVDEWTKTDRSENLYTFIRNYFNSHFLPPRRK